MHVGNGIYQQNPYQLTHFPNKAANGLSLFNTLFKQRNRTVYSLSFRRRTMHRNFNHVFFKNLLSFVPTGNRHHYCIIYRDMINPNCFQTIEYLSAFLHVIEMHCCIIISKNVTLKLKSTCLILGMCPLSCCFVDLPKKAAHRVY